MTDFSRKAMIVAALCSAAAAAPAMAQTSSADTDPQADDSAEAGPLEDILVTANKRVGTFGVQETPIAITAFGQSTLEDTHVSEIADLTGRVPNVFLNTSETIHGVNNFSIRGMAVYDTIPSNTPTVGIFSDGIYIGAGAASALSTFDNDSIEVLRGPQGLLFGRNVTAGAILVNTTNPDDELRINARASIESGPNFTESFVISGPLSEGGTLRAKVGIFRNDDEGYFTNSFDGSDFGKSHTTIARAALSFNPAGGLSTMLKYEHGEMHGQGPASQNHGAFSARGFDFSINEPGYAHNDWDQLISDTRIPVALGDGQIVNILGWRRVGSDGLFDADSTPQTFFHFGTAIRQRQISDELRYSGEIGSVAPTVGLYYYADKLNYVEDRVLAATGLAGGGYQRSRTYAIFSNFDISLNDSLILTLGARYSKEKKYARVRGLTARAASGCSLASGRCAQFNFQDGDSWNAFTPKVGLQWNPGSTTNVYAYYTKGFRSGGYNLRQTNLLAVPGPYDQEVENSFEIGIKKEFFDRRVRVNLAVFNNDYKDLQRAIFQASPTLGISQTTVNSANTRIRGVEGEVTVAATDGLTLSGHFGYLDNHWKEIFFRLSGPGPVTPADYALELPFLSKWSYGIGANYAVDIGPGKLTLNASFDHRDRTPSNDANTGFLKAVDRIDASVAVNFDNGIGVSVYAKNLTNQATTGLNNPLTFTPGETIAPLNKGRLLGLELRYSY